GRASLSPDALKAVGQAFDRAGAELSNYFGHDATQLESARLMLASALLLIAADGSRDVSVLKKAALEVMSQNYTSLPVRSKIQLTEEALTESYWRRRADDARRQRAEGGGPPRTKVPCDADRPRTSIRAGGI